MKTKLASDVSGIDTNVLCYALDPAFPEHKKSSLILKGLSQHFRIAINPTVIHETYHTLVYKQRWTREDAGDRIFQLIRQRHVAFLNQTKTISRNAIYLANKYELGGRDSLVLSNYLINGIGQMYTHDRRILDLRRISMGNKELDFSDPIG